MNTNSKHITTNISKNQRCFLTYCFLHSSYSILVISVAFKTVLVIYTQLNSLQV